MWSSRIIATVIAAGLLAACGFEPLYKGGRRGETAVEMASVRIEPIADRNGQILRNHLLDRLSPYGRPARPDYVLSITLTDSLTGVAVRKTEFPTRTTLTISATYELRDARSGRNLLAGTAVSDGGYNILDSEFATLAAEQDVRERVLTVLAGDIERRLAAYFRLQEEPPAVQAAP